MSDPVEIYLKLLGRVPDELERLNADGDSSALFARLVDQHEFRNRFRDPVQADADARMALVLWPPEKRDYDLHIVVASGEGWRKTLPAVRDLSPRLGTRHWLSVLSGEIDNESTPQFPRTDFHVFPGESVFQLRARLPAILGEAAWAAVLEDHAHALPMPGWLDRILRAIRNADRETLSFAGAAAKEASTSPWSWANFLFNFWHRWHPSVADQLPGTVATIVFRRDLKTMVRWVVGGRNLKIAMTLRDHSRAAELPLGTMSRIRWIGWCHVRGRSSAPLSGAVARTSGSSSPSDPINLKTVCFGFPMIKAI